MATKKEICRRNAQQRRNKTYQRAVSAINKLKQEKKIIKLKAVAEQSGVSLAWLYKEPEIQKLIQEANQEIQQIANIQVEKLVNSVACLEKRVQTLERKEINLE